MAHLCRIARCRKVIGCLRSCGRVGGLRLNVSRASGSLTLNHRQVVADDNLSLEIFSRRSLPGNIADERGADV
jgi:hypothetical protein